MEKRLYEICKMPLSQYNKAIVCFCHNEHPELRLMPEKDHAGPSICAGHATPELNRTIFNEYGMYGFNH